MLEFKKIFQHLLLIALNSILLSGSLLTSIVILKDQLDLQIEFVESKKSCSPIICKALLHVPFAISFDRNNQKQIDFVTKLQVKDHFTKLFFYFLFLFFIFKILFKETFFIYLVRVNYFVSDLDICILSAKAHPPTV